MGQYNVAIMSEVWTPDPKRNLDVSNLYDLMLIHQTQLEVEPTRAGKVATAKFAEKALTTHLMRLPRQRREVEVCADLIVLEDRYTPGRAYYIDRVNVRGTVQDVHPFEGGEKLPLAIALGMEVESMCEEDFPDEAVMIPGIAHVPITTVRTIKTLPTR